MEENKRSLRNAINAKCQSCTYDSAAPGTWRQQVTLCTVKSCPLYPVRPITKAAIPDSVLNSYGVTGPDRALFTLSKPQKGDISAQTQGTKGKGRPRASVLKNTPKGAFSEDQSE